MFNPFNEFQKLLEDFVPLYNAAQEHEDPSVYIARPGFVRHEQIQHWVHEQIQHIQSYRAGDYSDTELEWYESASQSIALFACLALGALLGLYSAGQIDDTEFLHGEALLPGFLLSHIEAINKNSSAEY